MKLTVTHVAFLLFALFAFAGCEKDDLNPTNPLVADAGDPTTGFVGHTTVLDGSLSTNAAGKPVTYKWEVNSKPTGSEVNIEDQDEVLAKFYGSLPGEYIVKLTISYLNWQDTDNVTITLSDDPEPSLLAVAGEDRSQEIGQALALNGSASIIKGVGAQILWENVSKPENSTVTIQNPNSLETTFNPNKAGEYTFKLTITLGSLQSQDLVKINVLESTSTHGPIIINADILQNRTLTNVFVTETEKLDYLVTKDIAIRGAKLTIEPGVRIGFEEGAGIQVETDGSLRAYSMDFDNNPIVFQGKESVRGYWNGIHMLSKNSVEYLLGIEIKDAGKLGYGIKFGPESKVFLSRSNIHDNLGTGVWLDNSSTIQEFNNNRISENETSPLKIPAIQIPQLFMTNEFQDGNIKVTDGRIFNGLENIWPHFTVSYEMLEDLVVYNGSKLILSEGTNLNMANDKAIRIIAGSAISILGSETAPVKIEGVTKQVGAWRGIYIENSQSNESTIYLAQISHAGSNPVVGQESSTIKLGNNANLKMTRTILDKGKGHGLEAIASNIKLEFDLNIIKNHQGHPISTTADLVENLGYKNTLNENLKNEVAVNGYNVLAKQTGEVVWEGFFDRTPYLIKGYLIIHSGMRIKHGVTIKMPLGSSIVVNEANNQIGYLAIEGNAGNPVIIQGVNESAGSWFGIVYSTNHPKNKIEYAEILHAGRPVPNNFSAAVVVDNEPMGSLVIRHSKIRFSGQHGIAVAKQFQDNLQTGDLHFESVAGEPIFKWE